MTVDFFDFLIFMTVDFAGPERFNSPFHRFVLRVHRYFGGTEKIHGMFFNLLPLGVHFGARSSVHLSPIHHASIIADSECPGGSQLLL
jgi:hypothetical protein